MATCPHCLGRDTLQPTRKARIDTSKQNVIVWECSGEIDQTSADGQTVTRAPCGYSEGRP